MALEWAWLRQGERSPTNNNDLRLPSGTGAHVFLLHGLTGSPTELAYVARRLNLDGGLRVWCPRLANHGEPLNVLAATPWRLLYDKARSDFLAARDAAEHDRVPLVVGGLSLGAVLSLLLAAEFPQHVGGVMCLAPTFFYDGWNVPWLHRLIPFIDYTPLKYFAFFREEPPYGLKDESLRERVGTAYKSASLRTNVGCGQHGYAHFPIRLFCESRHLIARCARNLRRVTAPLLLVQAVHDDATSPRNSRHVYRNVSSRQKEMLLLEDSFHMVAADLERDRVAEAMTRFCRRLSQA
ncbi:MAG TPA: alpha/beta fold hydrolase [Casimicrobiaceae bacterium]|jgi:carboxylesterase|nr:alpha/beta fold hydrolase [Casimicrobiaceae bacterium]